MPQMLTRHGGEGFSEILDEREDHDVAPRASDYQRLRVDCQLVDQFLANLLHPSGFTFPAIPVLHEFHVCRDCRRIEIDRGQNSSR